MPTWSRTVQLKDLLSDNTSDENVKAIAKAMSERLMRLPDYDEDSFDDFSLSVNELIDISESDGTGYSGHLTMCSHFNAVLDSIYDWADSERVWIA